MAESVFCKCNVLSFPILQKLKSVQVQLGVHTCACVYFCKSWKEMRIILMNWLLVICLQYSFFRVIGRERRRSQSNKRKEKVHRDVLRRGKDYHSIYLFDLAD